MLWCRGFSRCAPQDFTKEVRGHEARPGRSVAWARLGSLKKTLHYETPSGRCSHPSAAVSFQSPKHQLPPRCVTFLAQFASRAPPQTPPGGHTPYPRVQAPGESASDHSFCLKLIKDEHSLDRDVQKPERRQQDTGQLNVLHYAGVSSDQ